MKKNIVLYFSLFILTLFLSGCGGNSAASATLDDLVSHPEQYSGKTVIVEGIYINGWEWTVLADGIAFLGDEKPKELTIVGNSIWFAGIIPLETRNQLYDYTSPGAGQQHFGKLRVTGLFESGGKYGYLSQYKNRITADKVELLDWAPPEEKTPSFRP